ncbi:MAG: bestrophin family protein [Prochlorothrix sp.]|nr:bestrophin family ion channel [Prochlorothrix sp.]
MEKRGTRQWFRGIIQIQGSVIPGIWPRVVICGLFGLFISVLYDRGYPVAYSNIDQIVPSVVLGLLLVFRTNTAYDRFWEGRKIWGSIINTNRNLARQIWVFIKTSSSADVAQKQQILRLISAFTFATKFHLRGLPPEAELTTLVTPAQLQKLQRVQHPPLEVMFWINDYLRQQHDRGAVGTYQMTAMVELINRQVDNLGACERILKTPLPLAYSIHLRQLLMFYCLSLPVQWVSSLGFLTGWVTALVSFTLLGIEEIGLEIENPFGADPNDLPLDAMCEGLRQHVEDLMALNPQDVQLSLGNPIAPPSPDPELV